MQNTSIGLKLSFSLKKNPVTKVRKFQKLSHITPCERGTKEGKRKMKTTKAGLKIKWYK